MQSDEVSAAGLITNVTHQENKTERQPHLLAKEKEQEGKRGLTRIYTPCIYTLMLLWKWYTHIPQGQRVFHPRLTFINLGNQSSPTAVKHPELPLLAVQNQAGLTRSNYSIFKFISHQRDIWCCQFLFTHLQISHFWQSLFFIINHLQITTDKENRLWYCNSKHDMNQHSYHLNEIIPASATSN